MNEPDLVLTWGTSHDCTPVERAGLVVVLPAEFCRITPPFGPEEKLIVPIIVADWAMEPKARTAIADAILVSCFIWGGFERDRARPKCELSQPRAHIIVATSFFPKPTSSRELPSGDLPNDVS